jgi:protein-tyrosine phosphatase
VTRVLFVCLGNICRSPTAEGVMRDLLDREGLDGAIELDSAGTGAWHLGSPPDPRATAAAAARGVTLAGAARRVEPADFEAFDLIVAMDRANRAELERMAPAPAARDRIRLLMEFDPAARAAGALDVPDPYLGEAGFASTFSLVRAGCEGLLDALRP